MFNRGGLPGSWRGFKEAGWQQPLCEQCDSLTAHYLSGKSFLE